MTKYRYGLKSLKFHDIDPVTGLAAADTEKDFTQAVYRDTFDIIEEEGTTTDHFNETNSDPLITFQEEGKTPMSLSLADTSVETMAYFKGGEVVTADGKKTWSKPKATVQLEKYMEIVTQDGHKIIVPRAKVVARFNHQVRRNQIALLDLTITPQQPNVEGLAAMDMIDEA